jgi:hypothetical protein
MLEKHSFHVGGLLVALIIPMLACFGTASEEYHLDDQRWLRYKHFDAASLFEKGQTRNTGL